MTQEDKITQTSSLTDLTKALQGTYSSAKTLTYQETILKNIVIVYAFTDGTVSLHSHDDFVFKGENVSKNTNKVTLKQGDLLIYFTK